MSGRGTKSGYTAEVDEAQMIYYLKAGSIETALLIQFGEPEIRVRRVVGSRFGCVGSASSVVS